MENVVGREHYQEMNDAGGACYCTKPFNKETINTEKPIIIYGASVYGELAFLALDALELKAHCFCDRSRKGRYLGIPIIEPNRLLDYKDANIIIASADFFGEIKQWLFEFGCTNVFDMSPLLQMNLQTRKMSNRAKEIYENRNIYINIVEQQHNEGVNLHRVRFVVSERCSLKCRDCSHLMQYYQNPEDVDIKCYITSFDRLLKCVDDIGDLCILGGEPFLNSEIHELISCYAPMSKIHSISVYTNGTVIPNEKNLIALQHDKVTVHISDYGHNRNRINTVAEYFSKYNLKFFIRAYDSWQQGGELKRRDYTDGYKQDIFSKCFERNCYTFLRGKLHRCPRSAHAMNLGAMPDVKDDYVDFTEKNDCADSDLREQIIALLHKPFIEACNYCDGMNNITQHIQPAIQTTMPLHYEQVSNFSIS